MPQVRAFRTPEQRQQVLVDRLRYGRWLPPKPTVKAAKIAATAASPMRPRVRLAGADPGRPALPGGGPAPAAGRAVCRHPHPRSTFRAARPT